MYNNFIKRDEDDVDEIVLYYSYYILIYGFCATYAALHLKYLDQSNDAFHRVVFFV